MARYEVKAMEYDFGAEVWQEVWAPITKQGIREWYENYEDREYTDLQGFIEAETLNGNLREVTR